MCGGECSRTFSEQISSNNLHKIIHFVVTIFRLRLNILRFICVNCDLQSTLITDLQNLQTD